MRKNIALRALIVRFQGIVENLLEVGRFGSRVSVRHKGEHPYKGSTVGFASSREDAACHATPKKGAERRAQRGLVQSRTMVPESLVHLNGAVDTRREG